MLDIKTFQLNLMLVLSGICGTIAFFVAITKTIGKGRKFALLTMEIGAMLLLMCDRFAYVYRGSLSQTGYYMTRISNFLVFFFTLFVLWSFNNYLKDLYEEHENTKPLPRRLKLIDMLLLCGILMLVISQFTGFYYTFDENNCYQRAGGYPVCYLIPVVVFCFQLSVILTHFHNLRRNMRVALLLFAIMPLIASVAQLFLYGYSLINITLVGMVVLLYIFTLIDANDTVERAKNIEIKVLKDEQDYFRTIFVQTAEALASAIDAKDKYTHGHSRRVAEYSEKIARIAGLEEKEIEEVYFAALLHDVGKIGISDAIINKVGRLNDEEFAEIRKHPSIGRQILASISRSPYLCIGANYHHERYDGKGYPDGLKGKDIPNIARIIAVADAYDAMTSIRSYRDPLPQQLVREEFVKGIGTQFDPIYAKIMLHLIDLDSEYHMQERQSIRDLSQSKELHFDVYREAFTPGIAVNERAKTIHLFFRAEESALCADPIPSIILYDSLDAKVHDNDSKQKELLYFEYCEIRLDGQVVNSGARKIQRSTGEHAEPDMPDWKSLCSNGISYEIEAVRCQDHVRIRIRNPYQTLEFIIALPDSSRYSYLSLTGQNCTLSDLTTETAVEQIGENEIPRIADKVSYISAPAGDIPNIQIDGWRTAATKGIPLTNPIKLKFRSMSLPTARLVWHCPFIVLFTSEDQYVDGDGYREYALVRMDGECWEMDQHVLNQTSVTMSEKFGSWNQWKAANKAGVDCTASVSREGNTVTITMEAAGISVKTVSEIADDVHNLYAALTGDQCALTDIRLSGGEQPCP